MKKILGALRWLAMLGGLALTAQAQKNSAAYIHETNACNTFKAVTRLNHPDLNGNVNAHLQVTAEYGVSTKIVGVYFDGQYWTIANEDNSPMTAGLRFHVVIVNDGIAGTSNAIVAKFLHTVTTNANASLLTNSLANSDQFNRVFITNNQSGLRTDGSVVENNKLSAVSWDVKAKQHFIIAENNTPLIRNATYNVLALRNTFAQQLTAGQSLISAPDNAVLLVQRVKADSILLTAPLSVRYETTLKGWRVYHGNTLAPANLVLNIAIFTPNSPGIVETAPNPPSKLAVSDIKSNQINFTWGASTGTEQGYDVQYSTDDFKTIINTFSVTGGSTTNYLFTNLTPSTTYYFRARSYTENLRGRCYSAYSSSVSGTTQAPPVVIPTAPGGLSAVAVSSSQINLSWADNSGNETGFELDRSTDGTSFTNLTTLPANTTVYSNTGLTASTRYFYRVRAKNSAGNSAYANVADATTQSDISNELIAPINLIASLGEINQVKLDWGYKSTAGTVFEIWKSAESATDGFILLTELPLNVRTFTDKNLRQQTRFAYKVRVKQNSAFSPFSNTAQITTSIVTATTSALDDQPIRAYPNPFSDELQLALPKPFVERAGLQVFSKIGQLVWQGSIEPFRDSAHVSLSVLPAGHYMLTITGQTFRQTITIIKN